MRWNARLFRWHRWLAALIGLQLCAWLLGGLLFAWLPFQGWVKSAERVEAPRLQLPAISLDGLAGQSLEGLQQLQLQASAQGPVLRLKSDKGERWLTLDGREIKAPDAAAIARFAATIYRGEGRLVATERLAELPRRLGLVQELGGRRDVWRVRFDDAQQTRLYFEPAAGSFLTARSEAWVWYDFFWRLHVMDYSGGEDFNNAWLRAAATLATLFLLSGLGLLAFALRRRWRRSRR